MELRCGGGPLFVNADGVVGILRSRRDTLTLHDVVKNCRQEVVTELMVLKPRKSVLDSQDQK